MKFSSADAQAAGRKSPSIVYQGMGEAAATRHVDEQELARLRAEVRGDIATLDRLPDLLRADLSPERRVDVQLALPRIKLRLMESIWQKDLGDFVTFQQWVDAGASDPAPAGLEQAAAMFRQERMP